MKMKNLLLCVFALLIGFTASIFAQSETGIEGNWRGALDVGGTTLTFVLKISKDAENYPAKLDIPEQGAKDLPLDSLTKTDKTVKFSAAKFGFSYEGNLNEKDDEIGGTFSQGAAKLPLNFKRDLNAEAAPKRPQTPQKPFPYKSEEVIYTNAKDNIKLAGTLTLPNGDGKFPAVVLITGSGSQDRDNTIFQHKSFLVLADYLTRKGIAVLRVDDRGIGGSDLGSRSATTENFVGDVLTGVEFLKNRKEINPKQIGLIGHSEGGVIAPAAAVRSKDVAFIVMLAGTGLSGEEALLSQGAAIMKASGTSSQEIAENTELQQSIFSIIKAEPDNKIAEQKIGEMLEKRENKLSKEEQKDFAPVEKKVKEQTPALLSAWYRYFLAYDLRPTLEKVKIPVLALNGENDTQVLSKENLEAISNALKKGGNKDFTIKSFPKLNHLFQTSKSGLLQEYGEIEETISPQVLETISDWILKRTMTKN